MVLFSLDQKVCTINKFSWYSLHGDFKGLQAHRTKAKHYRTLLMAELRFPKIHMLKF